MQVPEEKAHIRNDQLCYEVHEPQISICCDVPIQKDGTCEYCKKPAEAQEYDVYIDWSEDA